MRPLRVAHIVPDLRRRPIPRQHSIIHSQGSGKLRETSVRGDSEFEGAEQEGLILARARKIRLQVTCARGNRGLNSIDTS